MLKPAILALLRQILTVAGTALVAKGLVQASDVEPVIGRPPAYWRKAVRGWLTDVEVCSRRRESRRLRDDVSHWFADNRISATTRAVTSDDARSSQRLKNAFFGLAAESVSGQLRFNDMFGAQMW